MSVRQGGAWLDILEDPGRGDTFHEQGHARSDTAEELKLDVGRCAAKFFGDFTQNWVLEDARLIGLAPVIRTERAVGGEDDAALFHVVDEWLLLEVKVELALVRVRLDLDALSEADALEHVDREVADTDVLDKSDLDEVLHRAPCVDEGDAAVDLGSAVGFLREHIVALANKRSWVVDEVEIEVVELEVSEGLAAGGLDVVGVVVSAPELGGDPKLLTLDNTAGEDVMEGLANALFVAIALGAIDVAIASFLD